MTYRQAVDFLGEARRFGMKQGLDTMRALAHALGQPQEKLRFIHLAGTNGKGSTAAFCESGLRAAGHRVGLFTSPHLVTTRERLQINRQLISREDFGEGMEAVRTAMEATSTDSPATFFEIMAALALWYFAREKVDWVVWETGLGGRLDATNIVTPRVCVITGIALDHQQYLGNSLAEIADEKAGIIKPGVPVISAAENPEAAAVIAGRAREVGCDLVLIPADLKIQDLGLREGRQFSLIGGDEFELGLMGGHQVRNAACAIAALCQVEKLSRAQLVTGLREAKWPGRFEVVSRRPPLVVDGAHNVEGAMALVSTWRSWLTSIGLEGANCGTRLIFASVDDKPTREIAEVLAPLAREVWLVRLASERSKDPAVLAGFFPGMSPGIYQSTAAMWRELMTVQDKMPTLVAGSLFLAGEVLAQRQGNLEDSELNERLGTALIR